MHLTEYPEDWSVTRGGYLSCNALRPLSDKMVQRMTGVSGTKMFFCELVLTLAIPSIMI